MKNELKARMVVNNRIQKEFIEEQIKYLERSIELREYGLKEDKWKLNQLKKDLKEAV